MPHRLALNIDLSAALAADGSAPEWVELIPAGPQVVGRDGRTWLFDADDGAEVLDVFAQRGVDIAIDYNHALELKAPKGEESPAAAWIPQLQLRGGALYGRSEWTPRGGEAVVNREYRYLSPVFDYDPSTRHIKRLVSVGLSNKPNLRLQALNNEENPVSLSAALAAALGVSADATDETAIAAVNKLKTAKAANNEQPSLERFVPRADYDALQARATNAEQALADRAKAELESAVNAEIDAALKAGKITPATETYHRASCADQAGLERFREFVKAAAVVAPDQGDLSKKPTAPATALNAEEAAMCERLGIEHAAFLAAKADK